MKIIVTGDWHIDVNNRVDDMVKTLKELVNKVIIEKPDYFIFCGDAYRSWHSLPIEMYYFERTILDIVNSGIKVILLTGNHDTAESQEHKGIFSFSELKTLMIEKVTVIDTPTIMALDEKKDVVGIFLPHIPKKDIVGSYNETFGEKLKQLKEEIKFETPNAKIILFSHAYINEAKLGAGDLVINNNNGVSAFTIEKSGVRFAFVSDIHKSQKIGKNIFLPGSVERVNFGEKDDAKGMIVCNVDTDQVEFIPLNARKLEEVILDLVNPGLVKGLTDDHKTEPVQDTYEYIMNALTVKTTQLKDAIVKIKIICTKEQKSQIDTDEDKIIEFLTEDIGINQLKSVSYEIVDNVSVRNKEVNESLSPAMALQKWIEMQEYDENTKKYILMAGEKIIRGV